MGNITQNRMIAWLEEQKIHSNKAQKSIIETLIRIVKNPTSTPIPEKIEYWSHFVQAYIDFHLEQTRTKPRITPAQGKNLKEIIYFLLEQDTIEDEEQALRALKYIFQNWDNLSQFMQNQVSLMQLNKNLPEILKQLKDGHHQSKKNDNKKERDQLKQQLSQ